MAKPVTSAPLDALCDVPGIRVGHAQNDDARTGCTVIVPENGAAAGVDVRGAAPGTREVDLLRPVRLVNKIHALLLTGGSAFGLNAAAGVQQYLEERKIGFDTGHAMVPIVPAAVIYDLGVGSPHVRPDKLMGYRAAAKSVADDAACGPAGAGCGATVGKIAGMENAMPGGIGQASERLGKSLVVGALAVVNAFGDVIDPAGEIVAGARNPEGGFLNTLSVLRKKPEAFDAAWPLNTTLVAVATNAALNKEELTKVAQMAHDGLARCINPIHTLFDGDIAFALSTATERGNAMVIGAVAAELVSRAVLKAVQAAR